MKFIMSRFSYRLILLIGLFLPMLSGCQDKGSTFSSFSGIYEPSSVVQLADGRLLIAEDEMKHAFSLLEWQEASDSFKRLSLKDKAKMLVGGKIKLKLDDLEGLAIGTESWIYAVTSLSRNSEGKRGKHRDRLVRFRVDDDRLYDVEIVDDFASHLHKAIPSLEKKHLNIEGLAFDIEKQALLLGLRMPLQGDKALLVSVNNVDAAFAGKPLSTQLVELDLGGEAVRSIDYDPVLKGYLIVSGAPFEREGKPFKLWLWKAGVLSMLQVNGIEHIGFTEGVTSVKLGNEEGLLLVMDDGQRPKKPAHYLFVEYERLQHLK